MNEWFAGHVIYRLIEWLRGEPIHRYLDEVEKIPFLTADEIQAMQTAKLQRGLKYASTCIPYYRNAFKAASVDVEKLRLPEEMRGIPVLSKQTVREQSTGFLNDQTDAKVRISRESTSGTSGHPVTVLKDRMHSAYIRAVMYRCYYQHGIRIGSRQARFWTTPMNPRQRRIQKIEDFILNRYRISAMNSSDSAYRRATKKLQRFRPFYFYGYVSFVYHYASWLEEKHMLSQAPRPKVIITTGEILYDYQRKLIERVFACPVINEYGSTEVGVLAFECPQGKLHINADHLFLETTRHNGQANLLLVTELNNTFNPLIRYQIGDLAEIEPVSTCSCGSHFPIISKLIGREDSFIVTAEGVEVFDTLLLYVISKGVKQYQGVQYRKGELVLKIVKNAQWKDSFLKDFDGELRQALGKNMEIRYEMVEAIEPDPSGKLRHFISVLNKKATAR